MSFNRWDTVAIHSGGKVLKTGTVFRFFDTLDSKELIDANFHSKGKILFPGEVAKVLGVRLHVSSRTASAANVDYRGLRALSHFYLSGRVNKAQGFDCPVSKLKEPDRSITFFLPPTVSHNDEISVDLSFFEFPGKRVIIKPEDSLIVQVLFLCEGEEEFD